MVKIEWLGHASFRMVTEVDGEEFVIYIDPWFENPFAPSSVKDSLPSDANLILLTHGHFDHIGSAHLLAQASTKPSVKLVSNGEISTYMETKCSVPVSKLHRMNKGGTLTFSFGTVSMVSADHSSSCGVHSGMLVDGGNACGYVLKFTACKTTVYHSGDTGLFGDMELIEEFHKPDVLLLCTGGHFTMGA